MAPKKAVFAVIIDDDNFQVKYFLNGKHIDVCDEILDGNKDLIGLLKSAGTEIHYGDYDGDSLDEFKNFEKKKVAARKKYDEAKTAAYKAQAALDEAYEIVRQLGNDYGFSYEDD